MWKSAFALVAIPLLAGAALAEPAERAAFAPETTKAGLATADLQQRDVAQADVKTGQPQFRVQDVDTDGDGEISFAELLMHHERTDF